MNRSLIHQARAVVWSSSFRQARADLFNGVAQQIDEVEGQVDRAQADYVGLPEVCAQPQSQRIM